MVATDKTVTECNKDLKIKNSITGFLYLILAKLIGWAAFGLDIAAMASNEWVRKEANGTNSRIGLWKSCESENNESEYCSSTESEPWLNATRAFMILGAVFAFIGGMTSENTKTLSKNSIKVAGSFFTSAATFKIIAIAVFSSIYQQKFFGYYAHIGYILAAVASGLSFVAGGIMQISAWKMPNDFGPETLKKWKTSRLNVLNKSKIVISPPQPSLTMPPSSEFQTSVDHAQSQGIN